MRALFVNVVFICLSLNIVYSQEQLPVEKKMTVGANGKVYVNKELGVYLWISDAPGEDSRKIRLTSDSSKKYTNPMYFDTEGFNTFRSPSQVDTVTKKTVYPEHDIIFEVYSDSKAPITKCKIVSGQSAVIKNKFYYSGNVRVAFVASDEQSGTETTYYSISANPFKAYSDSVAINNEGETRILFYSTDKTGNREDVKEFMLIVDNTPPVTTFDKGITKKIKLESTDNLSGVKTIFYQIDNGLVKAYSSPIQLKENSSIVYWAIDNLNNLESKKSFSLKDL